MTNEIIIRRAELNDAQSLLSLINFWYENYFTKENESGHLFSKFTWGLNDIKRVIEESEVAVAAMNNKIVSFYFINTFFEIGNIKERKIILDKLLQQKKLPDGKYAYSLAAATDKDYLRKGLNSQTLEFLRSITMGKYDYFVGVMSYDNIATHKSSLKMGWRHFGDIGIGLLAVIGTTDERNNLLDEYASR